MLGAIALALLASEPQAFALRKSGGASQTFCDAVVHFDLSWPHINLDFPGQPFFSDGNNDGIADQLQIGRAGLPQIAAQLNVIAATAPSDLQGRLRTLASDAAQLPQEPAPTTATQSRLDTAAIENVASSIQADVKGKKCSDAVGHQEEKENAANTSTGTNSGTNRQAIALAASAFVLLLNFPLIRSIWRHRKRPTLTTDGSRFTGNLRGWKVDTISGQVLHVQRETITTTSARGSVGPGGQVSVSTSITSKDTIRLALRDGTQTDVTLVNFGTAPSSGDVVTICTGRRRSRAVPFALLNHTTHQQTSQPQGIVSLRAGGTMRQAVFLMGLGFSAIITMFVAIFGGAPWMVAVWFALLVMFVITNRRSAHIDLSPLWNRANAGLERV